MLDLALLAVLCWVAAQWMQERARRREAEALNVELVGIHHLIKRLRRRVETLEQIEDERLIRRRRRKRGNRHQNPG